MGLFRIRFVDNNNGSGPQINAAQSGQKWLIQQPLYTFVNKQKTIKQFTTKQKKHLSAIQNWSTGMNIRMGRLAINPSLMLQKGQVIELPITPHKTVLVKRSKVTHPTANSR